jgi:serine protease Do
MRTSTSDSARRASRLGLGLVLVVLATLLAAPVVEAREKAFLGVTSRSLSGSDARRLDLDQRDGALIQAVYDDTAADEAGLRKGDVVIEFDGEKVFDDDDLGDMIRDHEPGDKVSIEIIRKGRSMTLEATLGSHDDFVPMSGFTYSTAPTVSSFFSGHWPSRPQLGVHIMDLNSQLAEFFEVEDERGVLVTRVVRRTPAAEAGLRAGDVVVEVNGERVVKSGDISDALEGMWGESVDVEIVRKGDRRTLTVELDDEDDG